MMWCNRPLVMFSPCAPADARRWFFFAGKMCGIWREFCGIFRTHRRKAQNMRGSFGAFLVRKFVAPKNILCEDLLCRRAALSHTQCWKSPFENLLAPFIVPSSVALLSEHHQRAITGDKIVLEYFKASQVSQRTATGVEISGGGKNTVGPPNGGGGFPHLDLPVPIYPLWDFPLVSEIIPICPFSQSLGLLTFCRPFAVVGKVFPNFWEAYLLDFHITERPGHWTMEMNGGSSAPYLACTPCVALFIHCLMRVEAEGLLDY